MLVARYKYAYAKVRGWHVGRAKAVFVALRYAATGDSGRFTSHGGWRVSHLRLVDGQDGNETESAGGQM